MSEFKIGDKVICRPPIKMGFDARNFEWAKSLWGKTGMVTGFQSCGSYTVNTDKASCNPGCLNKCKIEVTLDEDGRIMDADCYGYSLPEYSYFAWTKCDSEPKTAAKAGFQVTRKSKFNFLEITK